MPRLLTLILVSLLVTPCLAQRPAPILLHVFPSGGQVSESVEVSIGGTGLEGVTQLWFDHPGLRAFHLKGATFKVVVAPGTPPGHHDVRVISPFGVSNPRTFVVSEFAEVNEVEPNNTALIPQAMGFYATINGRITPTDVDVFTFAGKKGQRILVDLDAESIDSKLDASLRLTHTDGRYVAESRDTDGLDPFLDVILPADGHYLLVVRDVLYSGSLDHVYRLRIHDGPNIVSITPPMAVPGELTEFVIFGQNLGGQFDPNVTLHGRPLERLSFTTTLPKRDQVDDPAPMSRTPILMAMTRGFSYVHRTDRGLANPIFIAFVSEKPTLESEPNEGVSPQQIEIPCEIAARFEMPGDIDVFRFQAQKGQVLMIETWAARIGSAALPKLQVQKVDAQGVVSDVSGAEILKAIPSVDPREVQSEDELFRFTVPETGAYQVSIYDQYGTGRGDVRLFYRLSIRPERPDFEAYWLPPNTGSPIQYANIRRGGRTSIPVTIRRLDGFAIPIVLTAEDLPAGVTSQPSIVGAGSNTSELVLSASAMSPDQEFPLKLIAKSYWETEPDKIVITRLVHFGGFVTPTAPIPPNVLLQGGGLPMAPTRIVRGMLSAVRDQARFTLKARPERLVIGQGSIARVGVDVDRSPGFEGNVSVASVTNASISRVVAKAQTDVVLNVTLTKEAPIGPISVVLRGVGDIAVDKDATGKEKVNVQAEEVSLPVTLIVRPAAIEMVPEPPKEGAALGSNVAIPIKITRKNGFAGDVILKLAPGNAIKAKAESVTIAAGQNSTTWSVMIEPDFVLPTGPEANPEQPFDPKLAGTLISSGLLLQADAVVNGETVQHVVPLRLNIQKK